MAGRWGRRARAPKAKVGLPYKSRYEKEFATELELRRRAGEVLWWDYEPFRLKLSSTEQLTYTPDFAAVLADGEELVIYEVKGFRREDAMVKLKVAADRFPFRFFLVTKSGGRNGFTIHEVGNGKEGDDVREPQ